MAVGSTFRSPVPLRLLGIYSEPPFLFVLFECMPFVFVPGIGLDSIKLVRLLGLDGKSSLIARGVIGAPMFTKRSGRFSLFASVSLPV